MTRIINKFINSVLLYFKRKRIELNKILTYFAKYSKENNEKIDKSFDMS